MLVEHPAGNLRQRSWHAREDRTHRRPRPCTDEGFWAAAHPEVNQLSPYSPQVFLELIQAGMVDVRPAQIEFRSTAQLALLNGFPKQHGHSSHPVERGIGSAVFVDEGILVPQRHYAGDWLLVFRSHANNQVVPKIVDEVPEPPSRLRRQPMASTRKQK